MKVLVNAFSDQCRIISFDITLQDSDVRRLVMSQILTWLEHAKCTGISAVLLHHLLDEHEWPPPIQYYELNRALSNRRGWQYSPVNAVKEKRPIHTESLKKLIFMCHLTNNFSLLQDIRYRRYVFASWRYK
ncbi:hypothetical protein MAR_002909 [Mya arenaria]|uniref:Transposase n=1 Tax=Mya arenaria TaxID=6604 RepID=A0ABY7G8I2_MYAAR|nr:hypothetical protein MAR_002909 [Mya arenaria]